MVASSPSVVPAVSPNSVAPAVSLTLLLWLQLILLELLIQLVTVVRGCWPAPSSSLLKATYFCGAFFFLALLKLFSFLRCLGSLLRASGRRLREGLLLPCLVGVGWWLLFNNCTGGSQFSLHLQQVNLSQGSHVAAFLPEATGPGVPVPVSGESTSAQQSHAGWQLSAEAEACPSVLYSEVLEWNKNINTYTSFHGFCLILGIVLFCFGGDRLTLH